MRILAPSLTLLVALLPEAASGQAADAQEEQTSRVVMIGSREHEAATHELVRAVEGQLSDLPVEFVVEWVDQIPENLADEVLVAREITERNEALAVFWSDLGHADEVYLFLSDAKQQRFLVRRLDTGEKGVRYESMAVIVRSVVDAMLRGGEIGVEAAPAPPPEPPPPQPPPPSAQPPAAKGKAQKTRNLHFALEVGYALSGRSTRQALVHGVNLSAALLLRQGVEIFAGYVFRRPLEISANDISLDINTYPVTLGAGWAFDVKRFRFGGGGALILDYVVQVTRRVATDTAVPHDHRDLVVSLGPYAAAAVTLLPQRILLRLLVGAQFAFNQVRYISEEQGVERVIEDPWSVVPHGALNLCFVI